MSARGRNHWIKLYVEMNHDPKIGLLTDELKWRFVSVLLLAGELNEDGYLPELNNMAWQLRTNPETLAGQMRTLAGRGLVELRLHPDGDERWFISKFAERQAPATPTQRAQRARWAPPEKKADNRNWRIPIYKPLPRTSGIYMISFVGTGKAYIGSSKDIQRRVQTHLTEMVNVPGHFMHEPYSAVGQAGIEVQVLEEAPEHQLVEREQYWMNQYGNRLTLINAEATAKRHYRRNGGATNSLIETETEAETEAETEKEGEIAPARKPVLAPVIRQAIPDRTPAGFRQSNGYHPPADALIPSDEPGMVRAAPAAVRLLWRLTSYWPPAALHDWLAEALGDAPDEPTLRRVCLEWAKRGYKATNYDGIVEWYQAAMSDPRWQPPTYDGKKSKATAPPVAPNMPATGGVF